MTFSFALELFKIKKVILNNILEIGLSTDVIKKNVPIHDRKTKFLILILIFIMRTSNT